MRSVCQEAVDYVKSKLSLGAANRPTSVGQYFQAVASLGSFRGRLGSRFRQGISESWIRAIAIGAETAQAGNCGEQAAVAFAYLLRKGVHPLDYMSRTNGDHAFVVVGRRAGSDATKVETWGAGAFVCDPWYGQVFPAVPAEFARRGWAVRSEYRGE